MEQCQLTIPAITYAGPGSIEKIAEIMIREKTSSILLFTDKGVCSAGLTTRIEAICESVHVTVIDDLASEPSYQDVERVIAEVQEARIDLIIGVGGGSVMDASKIASIVIGAEYGVRDLLADPTIARKYIKTIMIPTTCGTGSEATCNAIVAIPEKQSKQGIVNNCMIPDYVILDANMIKKLPPKIIAATGVDALAHCVECFTSKKATILSDTYAREGAMKIFHNIREAYSDADNMEAKTEMLMGAYYGGIAITGSGTTAVHALSYPLGGKYHIAHGVSNAILFAHVMEFNKDACANRLALLCDAVYPEKYKETINAKADYIISEIKDIVEKVDIPTNLESFGVKKGDIDFLVQAGSQQTRLLVNNCKELSLADIRYIYNKLF
jgi:alcohol dehydrogenase class IV